MKSFPLQFVENFLLLPLKSMKMFPAVIKSDYALNTLVWIHHAVGLTRGHAFRSGIHECFEFRFALDFRLPVNACLSLDCEHGRP